MKENWTYRRGDIYLADLNPYIGSEQGGTRPVLLLQNNTGNFYCPTLIVAPLTARRGKKPHQPTHYLLSSVRGMDGASVVLLEQIKPSTNAAWCAISDVSAVNRWTALAKPPNQPGSLYPRRNGGSVMKSTLPVTRIHTFLYPVITMK